MDNHAHYLYTYEESEPKPSRRVEPIKIVHQVFLIRYKFGSLNNQIGSFSIKKNVL
jgi:hypothetical protein